MKRFYSIFMVAAAVATVFSCSKAENVEPSQPEKTPIVIKGYTDANVTSGLKSSLDVVSVLWSTTDQVDAFDATGAKVATSSSTTVSSDQKTAEFTFTDYESTNFASLRYPAETAGNPVGTITIPTEQAATDNSFANGANVAFAKVENGDIKSAQFKNLGGLLSIKINNDNIVSVELSANEVMTGTGTLHTETLAATPATNGEKRVLLNGGLVNGTKYYAVVYPGSYTGLKIVITDNQGRTATYSNPNTLTVGRNANLFIAELTVPDSKWKGPEWSYTFESKQFESNGEKELNNKKWTLAGNGGYWGYDGTKGQQFGSKDNPYTTLTLSSETFGDKYGIEEIVLNTSGASSVNATVSVSVGGTQFKVDESTTQSLTATATEYRFTSADGKLHNGSIVISYAQTSSKALYLKSIVVNPGNNSGETPSEKTYSVFIDENITNGKVVASKTEGIKEGEKVQFTITPNSNYELKALTINSEDWTEFVADNVLDFTMPAKDVTVSATFTKNEGGEPTFETYQHIFNAKPTVNNNITLSGVQWNIAATNLGNYNSNNYAGVQIGTSSKNGSITLTSASSWAYKEKTKIKEVRLWLNLGGTSVTPTVIIGGKAATSDGTTVVKNSSAGSDWTKTTKVTFTPASDGDTGVVIIKVETVKAGYICAIEIDCEENS